MKKPGWLDEFKTFISRGNVIDLAVGVVVGGAFTAIVTALVNDIINPLISLIIGGLDFSGVTVGVFPIGDLIMAIINFLCISFVVFWMVKIINRFNRKRDDAASEPEPEAPAEPTAEELLAEILAELKLRNSRAAAAKTLDDAEKEESSASER
ncbi:MAG: large conductance mechanosensitive channel protein MscL [Clostridiales bacterium]|nr:large conductance mechanosensitive channel protein MscL [Clostridiales bacterium]